MALIYWSVIEIYNIIYIKNKYLQGMIHLMSTMIHYMDNL